MQQQAVQDQYAAQRDARNQEILAQAAAMQNQAINSSAMGGKLCFGGKVFAEGGELNTQPQAEPRATQQDTEMAKYSDEELQDMINEYQEAESGEKKVTKGKLARLRKKAEKAQAELERRHAEENAEQPQEARQEPTQEELQAAAQEQAMQTQQPIEGQPQEMSPEQAMMMQQQMGQMGQGSPEEMAAMQQQGQYGYGGKLYLTGGELFQALGFSEVDENNPPIPLSELGIKHLYDQIDPKNIKDVSKIYAKATDPKIKALFARGYDPLNPPENTDQWFEPTAGENIDWGQAAQFKANGYTRENLEDMAPYLPYLQDIITQLDNSGYNWDNNLMPQDLMKRIQKDKRWRDTNTYLKADQANRKDYLAQIYNRMDELGQEDTEFMKAWTEKWKDDKGKWHNPLGKFEFNNETGKYEYVLNKGMEDLFDQQFWAKRSDGLLGRMYNIRIPAQAVPQAYELDEKGNPTGKILLNTDGYVQEGNTYSFYTKDPDNKYAPYINNQITYWKKKSDSSSSGKDGKSTLLQTKLNPQTNVTDYIMGALPGFTGLALQLGQGKPDMSGIEAAANAYANSMGAMAPVHLTHGLITPTLTSSWNNHNMLNAERLGVNRLLRNTGPAPS
jgi:flagellar biosynthesis GTPase FlhF